MSKDKIKLEYIAILSNFLPINLLGIINMQSVLITYKNDKTPKSKKTPVKRIRNKDKNEISISLSCQNKKIILIKKENNKYHAENPNNN